MSEPTLHPEFKEFLSCLMSHGVKFLIVGAHALAVLGRARVTNDIDVLVEPTAANARRLARALEAFGFAEYAKQAEAHFAKPERMATLGREPVRIDILSSVSGVEFAEAWKGRVMAQIGASTLPFLGLAAMIKTKRAAGRPKDLLDLALLAEIEPTATTKRPARARKKQTTPPAKKSAPGKRKGPSR
jgi:hypothetical protein